MDYSNKLETLVNNLKKSRMVNSYDEEQGREEAGTLAHSLLDMEESFQVFLDKLLPKLISDKMSEEEIDDVLFDIREEMSHIFYHIKDPKFFSYITERYKDDSK